MGTSLRGDARHCRCLASTRGRTEACALSHGAREHILTSDDILDVAVPIESLLVLGAGDHVPYDYEAVETDRTEQAFDDITGFTPTVVTFEDLE